MGSRSTITELPSGTYYIAAEANPTGELFEQSFANNLELREVRIKGRPGARRVIVPPWNGIETEAGSRGFQLARNFHADWNKQGIPGPLPP